MVGHEPKKRTQRSEKLRCVSYFHRQSIRSLYSGGKQWRWIIIGRIIIFKIIIYGNQARMLKRVRRPWLVRDQTMLHRVYILKVIAREKMNVTCIHLRCPKGKPTSPKRTKRLTVVVVWDYIDPQALDEFDPKAKLGSISGIGQSRSACIFQPNSQVW